MALSLAALGAAVGLPAAGGTAVYLAAGQLDQHLYGGRVGSCETKHGGLLHRLVDAPACALEHVGRKVPMGSDGLVTVGHDGQVLQKYMPEPDVRVHWTHVQELPFWAERFRPLISADRPTVPDTVRLSHGGRSLPPKPTGPDGRLELTHAELEALGIGEHLGKDGLANVVVEVETSSGQRDELRLLVGRPDSTGKVLLADLDETQRDNAANAEVLGLEVPKSIRSALAIPKPMVERSQQAYREFTQRGYHPITLTASAQVDRFRNELFDERREGAQTPIGPIIARDYLDSEQWKVPEAQGRQDKLDFKLGFALKARSMFPGVCLAGMGDGKDADPYAYWYAGVEPFTILQYGPYPNLYDPDRMPEMLATEAYTPRLLEDLGQRLDQLQGQKCQGARTLPADPFEVGSISGLSSQPRPVEVTPGQPLTVERLRDLHARAQPSGGAEGHARSKSTPPSLSSDALLDPPVTAEEAAMRRDEVRDGVLLERLEGARHAIARWLQARGILARPVPGEAIKVGTTALRQDGRQDRMSGIGAVTWAPAEDFARRAAREDLAILGTQETSKGAIEKHIVPEMNKTLESSQGPGGGPPPVVRATLPDEDGVRAGVGLPAILWRDDLVEKLGPVETQLIDKAIPGGGTLRAMTAVFEDRQSGQKFVVTNTKLYWGSLYNPYPEVRVSESKALVAWLREQRQRHPDAVHVLLGDFNSLRSEESIRLIEAEGFSQGGWHEPTFPSQAAGPADNPRHLDRIFVLSKPAGGGGEEGMLTRKWTEVVPYSNHDGLRGEVAGVRQVEPGLLSRLAQLFSGGDQGG